MRALDRKVLRDLRLMASQAVTIALVVASAVAGFLASLSAVDSLAAARDAFYASGRFADVFASVRRAPDSMAARLRALPGVLDVQTTVETQARISVRDSADPAIGQLIGLDTRSPQRLDRVQLRSGQWPAAGSGGELQALVSEGFAQAHGLHAGDTVGALLNGKQRRLRISGTALSPEYIFGGLFGMPDMRAFGVFWLDQRALAGALDMRGAFNHVALKLVPGASEPAVIAEVDRVLRDLGGLPPHGRSEQASHAMLDSEIREQRVLGTVLPAIFLLVAGFLLHVVTARLVAAQREQVAALKALGYGNGTIATHYLKLVVPIVGVGWLLGLALGDRLGLALTGLYAEFFRFPQFAHRVPPALALASLSLVMLAAALGTLTAVAATVRLAPAEAMRPPAPGRYRRALLERLPGLRASPALRMILRNLERRPLRALLTTGGIAAAVAIVILGSFFRDALAHVIEVQFQQAMRADMLVWTTDPVDAAAARELAGLPGVLRVEPGRRAIVKFVHGSRSEKGQIDGWPADARLQRVIDLHGIERRPGPAGLLMSRRLAHKLALRPGERVTVEVREGRRQVVSLRLAGTVEDMMGLNAWLPREDLNRLLGEGDRANVFAISAQPGSRREVLRATQALPKVAGAFSKATMLANVSEVSARNVLIMSTLMSVFAGVIAVGVVYNNARIALAERSWELASLRVLGFSRAEVSVLLLGELAWGIAVAVPLGMVLGWGLAHGLVQLVQSDQFAFPVVIQPRTYAGAALIVLAAGLASALVVRRRIDRLDMVAALKARE